MSHCAVHGCKTSQYNKSPGIYLHACPASVDMRSRWLVLLRNKCPMIDWKTTKICSKHFENKYFDAQRKLKDNAIPTIFVSNPLSTQQHHNMDTMLKKMTQGQLLTDIKTSISRLREPVNLLDFVSGDLQCKADAPLEAKLWVLIKKQEHFSSRLMDLVAKNKDTSEAAKKAIDDSKNAKKELEKSVETYKYIVKCLQEKQATLEEQVEILTAVESR